MFIRYRKNDETGTRPKDLSGIVKCPREMNMDCPSVTRDGKHLFFSGSFEVIFEINEKPFWADAGFIDELRQTELRQN